MKKHISLIVLTILLISCGQTTIVNELRVRHDFNGDGIADILVGARTDDDGGGGSGVAFIFFGSEILATTIDASNADVKLIGEDAADNFGFSVAGAGDFNDDGIDDVMVGADADDDGGGASGVAFIFFGSPTLEGIIDASLADVKLVGESVNDNFGISVSRVGDVNDDGVGDVIVGARRDDDGGGNSGVAFIFFGSKEPPHLIDAANADIKLIGEAANDYFGRSVSYAGDVNNDGIDDAFVGSLSSSAGGNFSGAAYIFYGSKALPALIDGSDADVRFIGEDANDYFGRAVSAAGDVNNDGYDDLIVGAYQEDSGGNLSGAAYIFLGANDLAANIDASIASVKLTGGDVSDNFGASVSGVGDINNDGFNDLLVGAIDDDDGGAVSGGAFIFFGSNTMPATIDASAADIVLIGADAGDVFGNSVSGGADVNNDGIADFIVSSLGDDDGGSASGSTSVFYGSASLGSVIDASAANVTLVGEDAGDGFGSFVSAGF